MSVFDRALFDSLGRVAYVSLEVDVCIQAGLPVFCFGGLECKRAGNIALPSFIASMNSVGKLVETILSRINIAGTNELAEAVESWRGASGCASLSDDPRRQKAWGLPIDKKNWDNMLLEADQVSRTRLMATAQKESRAWLNALPVSSLGTLLDSEALGWPSFFEWALMFVFLLLAAAVGGWTVEVCMACPANTTLTAFQGIRQ